MSLTGTELLYPWTVLDANGVATSQLLPALAVGRTRGVPTQPAQTDLTAAGLVLTNDGLTMLEVQSTAATCLYLRALMTGIQDGEVTAGKPFTVMPGQTIVVGRFPRSVYGNALMLSPSGEGLKVRAYSLG